MKKTQYSKLKLGAAPVVLGIALVSAPAYAQDVTSQDDTATSGSTDIVVTGTRIANPNLEQSAPVSVVGAEEISYIQPTSAEDFIRDLPGAVPSIGPQTNNGSDGSARANLRGLGSNRNLVLLNSRRVTPRGTDAGVDLNVIPVALLERVDVYTGGASTAYGADAVAGVLNFVTRRDFAGFDALASYGLTERGDGAVKRLDVTLGANFDDGRGNVVMSVGYAKTSPVLQGDRAIGQLARQSSVCSAAQIANLGCNPAIHNVTMGFPQGSSTAAPATILSPNLPGTGSSGVSADGNSIIPNVPNDYNFQPINLFQTPLERFNIYTQGRYEISSAVEAYAEAMYVRTSVDLNLAPAGIFGSTVSVPLNSPFLSAQQANYLCSASSQSATGNIPAGADCAAEIAAGSMVNVGIGRRFVEAGPRISRETTNMFHINVGLRGPLTSTLRWDISGAYGESDRTQTRIGWGLLSRARQAAAGCPAGSAAGCVPLNLFGPAGSITPEMIAFIDVPTYFFSATEFASAQGVISGDFGWASPWATQPVGIAVGAEYRRYFASSRGDGLSAIPGEVLGAGAAGLPISGEYDTTEFFGELVLPIVEDKPFFHNLTLEAGVRYADYSTSGGNWTWKVGGSWSPIRDIKFRGVYSRAVRAPNIAELFQPQVTALTARTTDPCQGTLAEVAARGPNHVALCNAQLTLVGAPTALLGTIEAPTAGQIQSTQGGDPNLDPEKARTITAGVVLQPSMVPGLSLTLDYFDIKVTDAISSPTQSDVIDGCFRGNSAFCSTIFRNPLTGQLSGPAETTFGPVLFLSNLGRIETSGWDLGVNYRRDLGFATLNWSLNGTYTEKNLFQATPVSVNRECVGYYSISCGAPQPKWSWNMRTTLSFGDTDVSLRWRHLSGTQVEPQAPNPLPAAGVPTTDGPTTTSIVEAYRRIPAYDYFDLSLQQSISDILRVTLTVTNLFDKDPPAVGQTIGTSATNSGGTFPTVYDPLGRRYTVGVNLRF
ncbi:MAG TPA: TonB-dependent receptor [Sphingopyxis sp.]|nr:TonB-dependent receptor [Sphingopyxis sp.]